eukprot:8838003-Pyramimonas_sp.AAC.1
MAFRRFPKNSRWLADGIRWIPMRAHGCLKEWLPKECLKESDGFPKEPRACLWKSEGAPWMSEENAWIPKGVGMMSERGPSGYGFPWTSSGA